MQKMKTHQKGAKKLTMGAQVEEKRSTRIQE